MIINKCFHIESAFQRIFAYDHQEEITQRQSGMELVYLLIYELSQFPRRNRHHSFECKLHYNAKSFWKVDFVCG